MKRKIYHMERLFYQPRSADRGRGLIKLFWRSPLQAAVNMTSEHGAVIVAAIETKVEWLPESLERVIPVTLDWTPRVGGAPERASGGISKGLRVGLRIR